MKQFLNRLTNLIGTLLFYLIMSIGVVMVVVTVARVKGWIE
jgi:hypothetical protein